MAGDLSSNESGIEEPGREPKEEAILGGEKIRRTIEAAERAEEEEKTNPEKIDELERGLEEHFETQETEEERGLRANKELKDILRGEDSRERDERIRDFLKEKRAEGSKVNLDYSSKPDGIFKRVHSSFTGESVFRPLSAYYFHNSYKSLYELGFDAAKDQDKLPELKGVSDVQEIKLENGEKGYLVKINKKKWPSLVTGGYALPRRGIAFIPNGLSRDAEKAIADHEIYHLNNHREEQLKGLSKIRFFRELETIWNTNIKKNLIGYAKFQVEAFILNLPNNLKNVAKNLIKSFKE